MVVSLKLSVWPEAAEEVRSIANEKAALPGSTTRM
jgi:hypothetical protein